MARLPARPVRTPSQFVLTVVFAGEAAGAAAVPQREIAGPEDQLLPSANAEFLIRAANSEGFPNRFQAYGRRRGTNGAFRLNAPRVRGWDRSRLEPCGLPADRRRVLRSLRDQPRYPRTLDAAGPHQLGSLGVGSPRLERLLPVRAQRGSDDDAVPVPPRPQTLEKLVSNDLTTFSAAPRGGGGRAVRDGGPSVVSNCRAFVRDTRSDRIRKIPALDGWRGTRRSSTKEMPRSTSCGRGRCAAPRSGSCACRSRISGRPPSRSRPSLPASTSGSRCRWRLDGIGWTCGSRATGAPRTG